MSFSHWTACTHYLHIQTWIAWPLRSMSKRHLPERRPWRENRQKFWSASISEHPVHSGKVWSIFLLFWIEGLYIYIWPSLEGGGRVAGCSIRLHIYGRPQNTTKQFCMTFSQLQLTSFIYPDPASINLPDAKQLWLLFTSSQDFGYGRA